MKGIRYTHSFSRWLLEVAYNICFNNPLAEAWFLTHPIASMRIGHHCIFLKVVIILPHSQEVLPKKKRLALGRQIATSTTHASHKYLPIMSKKKLGKNKRSISFRVQLEIITHGLKFVNIRLLRIIILIFP